MEAAKIATIAPLFVLWYVAAPITYIIAIVDTWHSHASVPVKLFLDLTIDALLSVIWPVTWVIWTIEYTTTGGGALRVLLH